MILQTELRLLLDVTLEAGFRIFAGIDDELAFAATGIHVETAGAVATFAALAFDALAFTGNFHLGVLGDLEILDNGFVANSARVHADVLRAGNHRRRDHDAFHRRAGDDQRSEGDTGNRRHGDCSCES